MAFTTSLDTDFEQAFDRLYGSNGTDNLAYTSDGVAITEVTANGNIGRWPTYFNQRLYMTNTTNKDRIYYSNPYAVDGTVGNFGTFNTDLAASPVKNAGFIILIPGGGVEITRLFKDSYSGTEYIYAYTKSHGIWRIAYASLNTDNSVAHTIQQVVTEGGSTSGRSVVKIQNDQWLYDGDKITTYGEVANYTSQRISPKSGRIKTETDSIVVGAKDNVTAGVFKDKIYYAYATDTTNNYLIVFDTALNAWSTPWTNMKVGCFLIFIESDGTKRLLAGSADSTDSYIYELETGLNDQSTAISANFETKAVDCGIPGIKKRFAFIDVFYATNYGTITYEVLIDEDVIVSNTIQVGVSASKPVGVGSYPIGLFVIGKDFDPNTTFSDIKQNDNFRVNCSYQAGKNISMRFTNNNSSEELKINGITIWYIPGSLYET